MLHEVTSYAATANCSMEEFMRAFMYWFMLPCYTMFRHISTETYRRSEGVMSLASGAFFSTNDTTKV